MAGRGLDHILFGIFLMASISLIFAGLQIKRTLDRQSADQTVLSKSVLLFAFAEVPSILGLVLFLLTGNFPFLVILCVISIVAFALVKPKS